MIKLGITGGLLPPNNNRTIFSRKELCYTEADFANYWASFGVMPVLIPNLSQEHLSPFLEQLDGLVLMGGTDITPIRYQETPIGAWLGDSIRDNYEFEVLDWFAKRNYPIFGICRGFQLLNVYYGGTLYQDLPTQFPSIVSHKNSAHYDLHLHDIQIVKEELFDQLNIGATSTKVNSIHHQGIKKLAPNLMAIAHAADGLVEAFYHKQYPKGKIMGVQWHPEFFTNSKEILINERIVTEHFLSFCR